MKIKQIGIIALSIFACGYVINILRYKHQKQILYKISDYAPSSFEISWSDSGPRPHHHLSGEDEYILGKSKNIYEFRDILAQINLDHANKNGEDGLKSHNTALFYADHARNASTEDSRKRYENDLKNYLAMADNCKLDFERGTRAAFELTQWKPGMNAKHTGEIYEYCYGNRREKPTTPWFPF